MGILSISFQVGLGQPVNNIGKMIVNSDTVWNKAGSPYNLTGNVVIDKGAILTIEPGVTVYLNRYGIRVNGTLTVRGTNTDNIYLIGGSIYFAESSVSWNPQTETGCIIENTVLKTSVSSPVTSIMINNNTITNYIHAGIGVGNYIQAGGNSIISKNVILMPFYDYDTKPQYGIGVSGATQVSDNIIYGAFKNAAVTVGGSGAPTIQRNLISNDYGLGIAISSDTGKPLIKENTITNCTDGILIDQSTPIIVNNNIEGITRYNVKMGIGSSIDVAASNNWWGTTDTAVIDQKIYDYYDDANFNLGKVNYMPILSSPNSDAPSASSYPIATQTLNPTATLPTTSQAPTETPLQPDSDEGLFFGLGLWQVVVVVLLGVIVVLLVFVVVFLRRRK